jgi:dTDP-4-dehydrorhamnose 3,5-epimerase
MVRGVEVRELSVPGAWVFTPRQFPDERGRFLEWFRADTFAAATGQPLFVAQANHSISRRGSLRGIHYADVPPGQGKYVYCTSGAVLDVVVDLRRGSPTFGQSDSVLLDEVDRRAVYLAEGLGHGFVAVSGWASVTYLCSTAYNPAAEHAINPADPALGLPWPAGVEPLMSAKDGQAPTLAEAAAAGLLPDLAACTARYAQLREAARGWSDRP